MNYMLLNTSSGVLMNLLGSATKELNLQVLFMPSPDTLIQSVLGCEVQNLANC